MKKAIDSVKSGQMNHVWDVALLKVNFKLRPMRICRVVQSIGPRPCVLQCVSGRLFVSLPVCIYNLCVGVFCIWAPVRLWAVEAGSLWLVCVFVCVRALVPLYYDANYRQQ